MRKPVLYLILFLFYSFTFSTLFVVVVAFLHIYSLLLCLLKVRAREFVTILPWILQDFIAAADAATITAVATAIINICAC